MEKITVIVPTSPNKFHPDTKITEECIENIRIHLPEAEIFLTFDGVRPEQEELKGGYFEFRNRMLWKCLHEYKNVLPFVFEEHLHQTGMFREIRDEIKSSLILYIEHDAPLTPDRPIDWEDCVQFIEEGYANTVRFHHEKVLPKEHEPLMINVPERHGNSFYRKTYQWSQRPHLSSIIYYDDIMRQIGDKNTFFEDEWHGVVHNDWLNYGNIGWNKHKLWIYWPDNKDIQRSYHLDARGGEKKFL